MDAIPFHATCAQLVAGAYEASPPYVSLNEPVRGEGSAMARPVESRRPPTSSRTSGPTTRGALQLPFSKYSVLMKPDGVPNEPETVTEAWMLVPTATVETAAPPASRSTSAMVAACPNTVNGSQAPVAAVKLTSPA